MGFASSRIVAALRLFIALGLGLGSSFQPGQQVAGQTQGGIPIESTPEAVSTSLPANASINDPAQNASQAVATTTVPSEFISKPLTTATPAFPPVLVGLSGTATAESPVARSAPETFPTMVLPATFIPPPVTYTHADLPAIVTDVPQATFETT